MKFDWTHGYFSGKAYTYGYYPDTASSRLYYLALLNGIKAPSSNFRYLDLGCGQGYNLILAAAHYPESDFVGIDFMPQHIAHARDLAKLSGIKNVKFIEGDFVDLIQRTEELGEFDYVISHGVTSWVAPEVRDALFKIAGNCLVPGGLMYNSYNCYPGCLSSQPFQQLVMALKDRFIGVDALYKANEYMEKLRAVNGNLFEMLPHLGRRLDAMKTQDLAYLSAEYTSTNWRPARSAEMLQEARQYKLDFVCSANLPEFFDESYPTGMIELIKKESDNFLSETIRDLSISQGFRRDIYVKGRCTYLPIEQQRLQMEMSFVFVKLFPLPIDGEKFKFLGPGTVIEGDRNKFIRLLELFGTEGQSFEQVRKIMPDVTTPQILKMICMLLHGGWLAPKNQGQAGAVKRLNKHILESALGGAPYRFIGLGSAQTAILLSDPEILLLALCKQSPKVDSPSALAQNLLRAMNSQGVSFVENGNPIDQKTASFSYAEKLVENFLRKKLIIYDELQVA
jgi:SAM-dependent methyltransferase